ncbi:MAG: class I adenylate-forming enzyme family protein, partial [Sphingopyxis sp.]
YTGGTSGAPKGAMITHGSIWHATHQMRNWQHRLRDGREAWYAAAPMTHIAGLIHFVALPVLAAGEVVLTERFSVDELIALVGARRITMLTAVPTMVSAIAAHPDVASVDWRGVSHVMGGGASLAPELARTFHALTGLHVQMGYAMTETSCGGAAMPAEGIEGHESGTGVPVPGMQIEIRRVGAPGETVAHDEVGEICLGGPAMFTGYWGRELDPNETTPDGLFRSGDLGRITPDGVLYVIDRIKDVIICSGYKVYPGVVEHAVLEHSAVLEAVAVGMPDAYRGETVIVVAALRAGTALTLVELQDFLRERLSAMETPKRLVLLPMLPKTENGKLSRHLVRAALAELSKTTGQEPNDAG